MYLVVFVVFFLFCSIFFSSLILLMALLTCKNRLPYNLYCVGGDVKTLLTTHASFLRQISANDNLCRVRAQCCSSLL